MSYQKSTPNKIIYGKRQVKVLSTACHYATKRSVKIMHLDSDNIIKLKFTINFDRCAILNVLNCLTKNLSLNEIIHYLFITKISMLTVTETADILFPVYDLLHIQIFYQLYTLDSVARWIARWPHTDKDMISRPAKRITLFSLLFFFFFA